jgi:hypothetical protein
MEDFKKSSKMQCFKEGGSVKYESRKEHKEEMSTDVKQDKAMIKKGVKQHESALHKGEQKTELKLKTGGRAKKDCGTVKKYKTGGTVENQYAAKKTDKDIKDIANTKRQKPKMLCDGGSMKKYAAGGPIMNRVDNKLKMLEERRALEKMARAKKYLGPSQQSELIKQSPEAAGLTPPKPAPGAPIPMPTPPVQGINAGAGNMGAGAQPPAIPGGMKKGGKAKKMNSGGTCS